MAKKKTVAKQAKKTAKPKAGKPKKATPKSKPAISKGKRPASKGKAAKAKKQKQSKRSLAKPTAALAFDSDKYDKIKATLGQLGDDELGNLWLAVYGYGDKVTEKHVPEDKDRLIENLADAAYELNPTPEQMTPKGLGDLLEAY